jgi:N-acetyltransferase
MVFPKDVFLENERALLRPLQTNDLELLLPYALNEPGIWGYSIVSPAGREGMERYINETIEQRVAGKEYPFIVFDKAADKYAGCTRFYDIQLANSTTQLGYTWYGKEFQRTGLNRHCKWLLLSYAFETWGVERVEFRADSRNMASINAMKGIGCQVEGILRSQSPSAAGGRRDSIVLSIIKNDWFREVRDSLKAKAR